MVKLRHVADVVDIINRQAFRRKISIAIICFLVGFLFVTQIKGQMAADRPLQDESEKDLAEIARDLSGELAALKAEAATLTLQAYKAGQASADRASVLQSNKKTKQSLEILAGNASVRGRGVRVTVKDTKGKLSGADLSDIVNELKAAGAEAIALDGVRVGANTPLKREKDGIYLRGKKIDAPYVVESVGDPETLYQALTMAGGIRDTLTSSVPGVVMELVAKDALTLPRLDPQNYSYARSVTK
ncbi:MAG: DUF881 domain-containing protein [Candidatus Aquicultorales bacterium]